MANIDFNLISPHDVMLSVAQRAKTLRLEQNITQQELADKVGIAIGTIKRFDLVLGRLEEFVNLFAPADVPVSLYELKDIKLRQRARKK